jgi:hypothetical protein
MRPGLGETETGTMEETETTVATEAILAASDVTMLSAASRRTPQIEWPAQMDQTHGQQQWKLRQWP